MNKKNAKFTEYIDAAKSKFRTNKEFYTAVGINKSQIRRLYNGEAGSPNTYTLERLQKVTSQSVEKLRNAYYQEFQSQLIDSPKTKRRETLDDEFRLRLSKVTKAEDIFHYFKKHQIVEISFEYNEINFNSVKNISDITNIFNLASKLIKEEWEFTNYFKLIPSSLGDFHNERENENLAKVSFINEMQRLIDLLANDSNYIFVGEYIKNFNFKNNNEKREFKSSAGVSVTFLKFVISNSDEDKIRINVKRNEVVHCKSLEDMNDKVRELHRKRNEKEVLEEELIEQAIESDNSDRYAQDQIDAFKDEGGLAELFNKE